MMSVEYWLVFAAAFTVLCACVVLVFHPDYDSGLVGTIGLALVAFGALGRVLALVELGNEVQLSRLALIVWGGLALFFGRLLWKFLARARSRGPGWYQTHTPKRGAQP